MIADCRRIRQVLGPELAGAMFMTTQKKTPTHPAILGKIVEKRVLLIRGQRVMLDSDLADLYNVPTKRFNEAVKRNLDRFPEDFMFQVTSGEWELLRSQIATSSTLHGGRRYLPLVFTENGTLGRKGYALS